MPYLARRPAEPEGLREAGQIEATVQRRLACDVSSLRCRRRDRTDKEAEVEILSATHPLYIPTVPLLIEVPDRRLVENPGHNYLYRGARVCNQNNDHLPLTAKIYRGRRFPLRSIRHECKSHP